jgi:ribonuclease HII
VPEQSKPIVKLTPTYQEEAHLLSQGFSLVAGLDEVGRGPLAGPVMAGVALLPQNPRGRWVRLIRDSKQLTPAQRETALSYLQDVAVALEVGASSPQEIDALGIVQATRLAMSRAISSLSLLPQYLLLDAIKLPDVQIPQKSIIYGDALCLSIAAASIAAKVARDRLMEGEDEAFPGYGFGRHKGYGTREHISNLKRLGPCEIHRYSFAPVRNMAVLDL